MAEPVHPSIAVEDPWISTVAGQEFQIMVADRLLWTQWIILGPERVYGRASDLIRKSIWRELKRKTFGMFENLMRRSEPVSQRPDDPDEFDQWAFDFLRQDWNATYKEIGQTGTFLGYLAGYLSGNLDLPPSRVEQMGLQDMDIALRYKAGAGLDRPDLLTQRIGDGSGGGPPIVQVGQGEGEDGPSIERMYALAYAQRQGAEWIAVYDENGQRAGRPYEIVSRLYRKQISDAILNGETTEQLRSRMVFPDLLGLLEKGEITLDEYIEWNEKHLNRDFHRFAVTEANYAWSNGRLAYLADRSNSTGRREYVQFSQTAGRGQTL